MCHYATNGRRKIPDLVVHDFNSQTILLIQLIKAAHPAESLNYNIKIQFGINYYAIFLIRGKVAIYLSLNRRELSTSVCWAEQWPENSLHMRHIDYLNDQVNILPLWWYWFLVKNEACGLAATFCYAYLLCRVWDSRDIKRIERFTRIGSIDIDKWLWTSSIRKNKKE